MGRHHEAEQLDPHWALLPEYRIEGHWHDGLFIVSRADDKLVLSRQFLDALAIGESRTGATLDVRPCRCGLQCFHGAILSVDPHNGPVLKYRLTEQIEDRTVWWAERYHGDEQIVTSVVSVVSTPTVVGSGSFDATIEVHV